MTYVLLIIHLFVTLALIGVVLIQRSEGGGLGIGSSQGMGSFMSGRGTANLLTRTTAILGTIFFLLSLALALLNRGTTGVGRSILDAPTSSTSSPAAPAAPLPTVPGLTPSVPASPAAPPTPSPTAPSATAPEPSALPPAPPTVSPDASPAAPPAATAPPAPAGSAPATPTVPR
jgi:preprotein translocase subunit SecG